MNILYDFPFCLCWSLVVGRWSFQIAAFCFCDCFANFEAYNPCGERSKKDCGETVGEMKWGGYITLRLLKVD